MKHETTMTFESHDITEHDDGYEIDMNNLTIPEDAGMLFCAMQNDDLLVPEGYKLDVTKPVKMIRSFQYSVIPCK